VGLDLLCCRVAGFGSYPDRRAVFFFFLFAKFNDFTFSSRWSFVFALRGRMVIIFKWAKRRQRSRRHARVYTARFPRCRAAGRDPRATLRVSG